MQNTPVIKGLMEGENEAEWIVDLTVQADRQGKAGEFAGAFAASRHKTVSDEALQSLLRDTPSMLGGRVGVWGNGRKAGEDVAGRTEDGMQRPVARRRLLHVAARPLAEGLHVQHPETGCGGGLVGGDLECKAHQGRHVAFMRAHLAPPPFPLPRRRGQQEGAGGAARDHHALLVGPPGHDQGWWPGSGGRERSHL